MLLLDIGNRRLKWAWWRAGALHEGGARAWRGAGLAALFEECLDARPERVLACSVAGAAFEQALVEWCTARWSLQPRFLRSTRACAGVVNGYARAQQLGADRWAALIGLRAIETGAACVIDCGTAVTLDVLDASGQHLGGSIAAGLMTTREALGREAYNLDAESAPPAVLADNTRGGIQGGTLYALAGAIDRLVAEAEAGCGLRLARVITGGDAALMRPLLSGSPRLQPHLVLHGVMVALGEQGSG